MRKKTTTFLVLFSLTILFLATTCSAQYAIIKPEDVGTLKGKELNFKNKPLKDLINIIHAEIKSVVGDPTLSHTTENNFIGIYLVSKEEYLRESKMGKRPLAIVAYLSKTAIQYPPLSNKDPNNRWNEYLLKAYGNMIINHLEINGND